MRSRKSTPQEHTVQSLVPPEEQPYEIPEDWKWVRVGYLIDLHRGVSYPKNAAHKEKRKESCLIMRGGNIEEGNINFYDNIYVDKLLVKSNQLVKKHDVIIVSSTGSTKVIGRAGISYDDYLDVAFGAFLTLVRSREEFDKKLIALFFQTEMYRNAIRGLAKGTNLNNISTEYIENMPLHLPPLHEQQRIVSRIESLFEKLNRADEIIKNVFDKFSLRKAAILHQAFTGELTAKWRQDSRKEKVESRIEELPVSALVPEEEQPYEIPEGWKWVRMINGFAECLDNFRKPINANERAKREGDIPYYGATGQIGWIDDFLTNEHLVLVGEDGAPFLDPLKNKAYIINGKAWVNNHAHILKSHFGNIGNVLLMHYLNIFNYMGYINGTTRLKLTQSNMNKIPFPLPPLAEQKEIVCRLESLFEKEERAKELCDKTEKIELMKKAILARVFRGLL
jgi:type I restriction enzyme S subunit